jgi:hypothetical protein
MIDASSDPTAAPAGIEPDALLKCQNLTRDDIAANRAGRVSPRQVAIIAAAARRRTIRVVAILGALVVTGAGLAMFDDSKKHDPTASVVIAATAIAVGLLFAAFYALVLRLPSKVAERKVTLVHAPVTGLIQSWARGEFVATIEGVRYIGFTGTLPDLRGKTVNAYVVADGRFVVAFEPAADAAALPSASPFAASRP